MFHVDENLQLKCSVITRSSTNIAVRIILQSSYPESFQDHFKVGLRRNLFLFLPVAVIFLGLL